MRCAANRLQPSRDAAFAERGAKRAYAIEQRRQGPRCASATDPAPNLAKSSQSAFVPGMTTMSKSLPDALKSFVEEQRVWDQLRARRLRQLELELGSSPSPRHTSYVARSGRAVTSRPSSTNSGTGSRTACRRSGSRGSRSSARWSGVAVMRLIYIVDIDQACYVSAPRRLQERHHVPTDTEDEGGHVTRK